MNDVALNELRQIILDYEIVCPISGTKNWTDVRQFNLMFSTEMGSTADGSMKVYLRPETAQGIFVNFLNVQKTGRMRIPFGIAQIGKAFRNEIVARQFIFRMREFEQMEMQFFVRPGEELKWFAKWKETRLKWHKAYPDLKANQNFLELQAQLEGTENRIATERSRYTDAVNAYNKKIRKFPALITAKIFGFDAKPQFKAEASATQAPTVEF